MFDEQGRKIATSKNLEGISDLVVAAPIKQGFVPAFETITYEGRVRLVMKALFRLRSASREYELLKPFADSAERIQSLRSFRLGILPGSPATLLLAATFNGAWEPYMRLIWNPLGPMLDVIFCNCEGYVAARDHSFAAYAEWVRKNQVDADFFYATTGLTVSDLSYLSKAERIMRDHGAAGEAELIGTTADDPVAAAKTVVEEHPEGTNLLAVDVLRAMYRLADYYPVDQLDGHGKYLIRATQGLIGSAWEPKMLPEAFKAKLEKEVAWFETKVEADPPVKEVDRQPDAAQVQMGVLAPYDSAAEPLTHGCLMLMQVTDPELARRSIADLPISWEDGNPPADGIFVNLAFTRRGLEEIGVPDDQLGEFPKEFEEGMEARAGLLGDVRDHHPRRWRLPKRWNPQAWAPLQPSVASPLIDMTLVPGGAPALPLGAGDDSDLVVEPPAARMADVDLSEVDLMIQLRIRAPGHEGYEVAGDPDHPLYRRVVALAGNPAETGWRLLAVESMRRTSFGSGLMRDHFGFVDGVSQPVPKGIALPHLPGRGAPATIYGSSAPDDLVAAGELLCGFANDRTDPAIETNPYLADGSFLVVRKLRQSRMALRKFLDQAADDVVLQARAAEKATGARRGSIVPPSRDEILAKMMGRDREGNPLVENVAAGSNHFDFGKDKKGERCPLRSHIRRTNPRTGPFEGRKGPRIMRRGMSYGPPFPREGEQEEADRGLIFMCYNASIAEQYEVIQRWLNGANPTGISSSQNDPLTGIGTPGDPRTFRFLHKGQVYRVKLDDPDAKQPGFIQLQWGQYLFAPARAAVDLIAKGPQRRSADELADRGERIIRRLEQLDADGRGSEAALGWKTCLEDSTAREPTLLEDGPAVWAAIRARGGILRVPYGDWTRASGNPRNAPQPRRVVLVGSRALVDEVFRDPHQRYSVAEHGAGRMPGCFGRIYIGRNADDPAYRRESAVTNQAIMSISEEAAFKAARAVADEVIARTFTAFAGLFNGRRQGKVDLRDQFITPALAALCRIWFGLPDGGDVNNAEEEAAERATNRFVVGGGWDWRAAKDRLPRCPGDFMSLSRYLFIPDPLPALRGYARTQGQRMHEQVSAWLAQPPAWLAQPPGDDNPVGRLTRAMWEDPVFNKDPDQVASNLIGIMTGFLPPADGNLRLALHGWLEEKELWRVQHRLTACPGESPWERASQTLRPALIRAMRERPAPDMVLRTAREDHQLGGLTIRSGEEIYVGIIGASQQDLDDGDMNAGYVVFGGNRREEDAPTHACPGYRFAMGTMLGIVSALLENCKIEALPAPLKVQITDPNWQPPSDKQDDEAAAAARATARQEARPKPARPARTISSRT